MAEVQPQYQATWSGDTEREIDDLDAELQRHLQGLEDTELLTDPLTITEVATLESACPGPRHHKGPVSDQGHSGGGARGRLLRGACSS